MAVVNDPNLNEVGTTYKPTSLLDRIQFNRVSKGKGKIFGKSDDTDLGWSEEQVEGWGGTVDGGNISMAGVPPTVEKPNWAAGIQTAMDSVAKTQSSARGPGLMGRLKY